ncbi:unnamed protein product [Aphanomyces euteiches]|uniref:Uncharacterized protein n=1 Tax=Aphanomyces euteiches TaxID=100861 RepID=A0A6G0XEH8_9STRA|nr:hypothetical protein Ae201684_005707 [Aphanomyces euteiches]KAH9078921.1 hypothetical protein Ae201684P_019984 [Aphanomyces euteiches]KAH9140443.1 hypothetical protein AeRB84_015325 [Aphanomyces euteiches]
MVRPGQEVKVQGLVSSKQHNGKIGLVKVPLPNQDPERVRVKLHGEKQPLSVRPTNLVAHGPIPTPELREAVLVDVGSGEMPMRMSVRSLRSGMDPCHVDVPMFVHSCVLMCGRCGIQDNTDFMARVPPPYRRVVRLECVECVAFLVAEAGIDANDRGGISDFVEGRYMGSIETIWKLQGSPQQTELEIGEKMTLYG